MTYVSVSPDMIYLAYAATAVIFVGFVGLMMVRKDSDDD